jgi:hypothetical protein
VFTLDQVKPEAFFCKTRILVGSALHVDVNSKFKDQNEVKIVECKKLKRKKIEKIPEKQK